MEETKMEKRNLEINFDKRRLHSSIDLHLRRTKIPTTMIGSDILRGVIFGMLRHPEFTVKDAVERAVDAASFLGNCMSIEDGYDCIFEVLEAVMDIDYSKSEDKVIEEVVEGFTLEIRKEFCYEMVVRTLEKNLKGYRKYSIGGDFLKCMAFKKVYAPESTYGCMVDYALKKVGMNLDEKLTIEKALEYLEPFLEPEATEDTLRLKIGELVDEVYEFARSESK